MAKGKRAAGEGTIRERRPGVWEGRLTVEEDGKKKQVSFYGKTQAEVVEKMTENRKKIADNRPVRNKEITLGELLDKWYVHVSQKRRANTVKTYGSYMNGHVKPDLGHYQVSQLTPAKLEKYFWEKAKMGLQPRSVGHLRAVLRAALSFGEREGWVDRNVAKFAEPPAIPQSKIEPFTPDQIEPLLQAMVGERLEALFYFVLATGTREGEALGVTWPDVDLDAGTVHIQHTLLRQDGEYVLDDYVKNSSSNRILALPDEAVALLNVWKTKQDGWKEDWGQDWGNQWDLVFTTEYGRPLHQSTVLHSFQRMLDAWNKENPDKLPRKRFYDLRHSCASYLIFKGASLMDVKEQLGHSQIALTANTYGHLFMEQKKENAKRMGEMLKRKEKGPAVAAGPA